MWSINVAHVFFALSHLQKALDRIEEPFPKYNQGHSNDSQVSYKKGMLHSTVSTVSICLVYISCVGELGSHITW